MEVLSTSFLYLFTLPGALLTVYLLDLGLSLSKIMILASVLWIVATLLEIPSGIFADLYGRKNALVISGFAYVLAMLFLAVSQSYVVFFAAWIFTGIKLSFKSGSDSALLYDTLVELGRKDDFARVSGYATSWYILGTAISVVLGAVIAHFSSIRTTLWLMIVVAIATLVVTLTFTEPRRKKRISHSHPYVHLLESLRLCWSNKRLKGIIIFFALLWSFVQVSFQYVQVFLRDFSFDILAFGGVYAVLLGVAAVAARYYGDINSRLSDSALFTSFVVVLPVVFFMIGMLRNPLVFLLLFCIVEVVYGLWRPASRHFVNREVGTSHRATVVSISGLLSGLLLAVFQPLSGWFADAWGVYFLFVVLSGFSLFALSFSLSSLRQHL